MDAKQNELLCRRPHHCQQPQSNKEKNKISQLFTVVENQPQKVKFYQNNRKRCLEVRYFFLSFFYDKGGAFLCILICE